MTENRKLFIGRFVYPLAVALTLFISSGIYSLLDGKSFLYLFEKLDYLQWILLSTTLLVIYVLSLKFKSYKRRIEVIELQRFPMIMFSDGRHHSNAYTIISFGYEWMVTAPEPSKYWSRYDEVEPINPDSIRVKTPPRCPKCKTELLEDPRFFGGYNVRCPRQDFSTRSKKSFNELSYEVRLIMKNEIEKKQQEK